MWKLMWAAVLLMFCCCAVGEAVGPSGRTVIRFRRIMEPRETAFTVLVPEGWKFEGGVLRVNPLTANGALNTVSAKFDFRIARDGGAFMHFLPSITYKDSRRMGAAAMGFPPGSSYMGARVMYLMDAQSFLAQYIFPQAHPQARNLRVVDRGTLPALLRAYQAAAPRMAGFSGFRYDSAVLTVMYEEGGVTYKEKLMTIIEDMGDLGVGAWSNKDTMIARAPAAEFDRVAPVFSLIHGSLTPNPVWIEGERRGSAQRAQKALETQRYVSKVAAEIVENRRRTNAEIAYNIWLNMTNHEDYVNPHTGQVELGSNQWKHRWQAENGDVIYTDDESYDPNHDPRSNRADFKRSQIRPR
ncbi:MAG: hypothetical protein JNL98_24720 [Bryobacterales bacterium]|nr:hypothetical protein [Bryobacterales bacterium]